MQIPNAPQRCRWNSQSAGPATILKPQEAFRQLSKAVAVACVMSAAKDQVVTRIPDATPVQDIRFFEWVLGMLYPNIVAWGSEQIDNGKQQSKYIVQLHLQLTVHVQHQQLAHDKLIQIIPRMGRMGRKKVDRRRHGAELVNQGATLVF